MIAIANSVTGFVTIALGGIAAWLGGRSLVVGLRSRDWPTFRGRIVSSHLHRTRHANRNRYSYEAQIVYVYEDEAGESHQSSRVHCGFQGASSGGGSASLIERYPEAKNVDVYYDPDQPKFTVLEQGVAASSVIVTLIGSVLLVIGGLILAGVIGPQ